MMCHVDVTSHEWEATACCARLVALRSGVKMKLESPELVTGWSKTLPARPQGAKGRSVLRYVEPLSDARTKLEAFFNILI